MKGSQCRECLLVETAKDVKMELLSPTVNYFVLEEKLWDWGGGDIYNEDGMSIGNVHRKRSTFKMRVRTNQDTKMSEMALRAYVHPTYQVLRKPWKMLRLSLETQI